MSRDCTSLNGMALSCHPERSEGSVSLALELLRCPQHDRVGSLVTLSRSEGSVSLGLELLRCPQHDRGPSFVTLSAAKGLSPWASRCFVALSMTGVLPLSP